jgi:nucleotide-binding universal stress UspA family protein
MLRLRRILFPTDFSALSDRALDYALELAGRFGAEIHMLHAVVLHADDPNDPLHHFPDAEEIGRRLEEIADQRMESRVAEWKGEDRPVVVRARRRGISTAPVILEYAAEIDADLVVMSTHGRRGLSHILMGSVTEEVVRLSGCPVLTVRGREATSEVPRPGTILVPVDFSGHAATALAHARELAAVYGSRVRVLHVFERPMHPEIYIGGMPLESLEFGRVEGGLREALETFVREAPGPDVETELHIVEGRAAPEILSFAGSGQADLVVIATHGLTGMTHMLLGSVTEKVVRRAPCPVLTVKSFGHSLVA